MGEILELNRDQLDQLKIMIRNILRGEVNCAESIGFIISYLKKEVEAGRLSWEELGTTEEELLQKKGEATQ